MPARKTPLVARRQPVRAAELRRVAPVRAPRASLTVQRDRLREWVWAAVRAIVWVRCKGLCEGCGEPLDPAAWDAHHRQLRSRGGPDAVTNAVALHSQCHTIGPDAVHQDRQVDRDRGLMVRSWEDPETVPLVLPDGRRVLLLPSGQYGEVPEVAA